MNLRPLSSELIDSISSLLSSKSVTSRFCFRHPPTTTRACTFPYGRRPLGNEWWINNSLATCLRGLYWQSWLSGRCGIDVFEFGKVVRLQPGHSNKFSNPSRLLARINGSVIIKKSGNMQKVGKFLQPAIISGPDSAFGMLMLLFLDHFGTRH